VVFDAAFAPLNNGRRFIGKAFDDRAACAVLLEAVRLLIASPPPVDVFFSFSAQEEFLLRGAQTVFNTIKSVYQAVPKVSISLDIGVCGVVAEGGTRLSPIEMGKGPAIKLRDKSGVSHYSHVTNPALVDIMEDIAHKAAIPYQYDFLTGCTNADVFACQECGVYAGGLGFAVRNTHSPVEIVDLGDLEATLALVAALASKGVAFDCLP
jgi:endoglucanase